MIYLIASIAVAICILCVIGLLSPPLIVDRVRDLEITRRLRWIAVAIRLVFGAILMLVAFDTAFPIALLVLGALIVLAGIALIFIDEERLAGLVRFVVTLPVATLRIGFAIGLLLGLLLLYAVIA